MRFALRAAVILPLFFVLCALGLAQIPLATASAATTAAGLTLSSSGQTSVRITLAPGPNTVIADIDGTYVGQLAIQVAYQGNSGPLRTWPAALIANQMTAGSTGISANATGTWSTTISGPGYAYLTMTSWVSGSAAVYFSAGQGPAGSSSIVSISSSALLKTNGASVFSLWSTSEASNNVTSTPAAITTTGGGGPIVRAYVICTNTGTTKVWIAACSGGHTFPLPAGSQIYVPAATGVSLYALAPPGSTSTVVCSEVGY